MNPPAVFRLPAGETHVADLCIYPKFPRQHSVLIRGEGSNVSTLVFDEGDGLDFFFEQDGMQQPWGLTLSGVTLKVLGAGGTAVRVSYGQPAATNDHAHRAVRISDVVLEGDWANGIELEGVWNATLDDLMLVGKDPGLVWNNLQGVGLMFKGCCVNCHVSNVRTNFWATGVKVESSYVNSEGLFFSNCSMVAVKRGLWVRGNTATTHPRMSTVTWTGGLIEARVGGVVGGSAAVHLENTWSALFSNAQFIAETISENIETTYGLIAQDCQEVKVNGCSIHGWIKGVCETGNCFDVQVLGTTFRNTVNPWDLENRCVMLGETNSIL